MYFPAKTWLTHIMPPTSQPLVVRLRPLSLPPSPSTRYISFYPPQPMSIDIFLPPAPFSAVCLSAGSH